MAMPFTTARGKPLPETWHGFAVIDGDKSDERRLDPAGVVVGLRAKGHKWRRPGGNDAGFIRPAVVAVSERDCDACGADVGEVCRPDCIGVAAATDAAGR